MKLKISTLLLFVIIFLGELKSQVTFDVNGARNDHDNYYVFKNADIHVDYQKEFKNGILIIKNGKIEAVGDSTLKIPANAVIYNLEGKHIYPSFIDVYTAYGMPKIEKKEKGFGPQFESNTKGAFGWNEAIKSYFKAGEHFKVDDKTAEKYRKAGFGVTLTHQPDGIMRGTSALVMFGNEKENLMMIDKDLTNHLSFDKGSSTQDYPGSLMGCIALIKQTYLDAKWYADNKASLEEYNIALEYVLNNQLLPQIFETKDKQDILRADKLGDEFGIQYVFKGNGDEYQRLDEIKQTNGKLIIPLNFPKPYDVEDPYDELMLAYSDIKHWEMAPYNPYFLYSKQIPFIFTSNGLKEPEEFINNLRKAVKCGLPKEEAIKAVTLAPAELINKSSVIGSLDKSKLANFIITSADIFDDKAIIHENWIRGKQYVINPLDIIDIRGKYNLSIDGKTYDLEVKGKTTDKLNAAVKIINEKDTNNIKVDLKLERQLIALSFNPNDETYKSTIRLSGKINHNGVIWDGNGMKPDGKWFKWAVIRKDNFETKNKKNDSINTPAIPKLIYPSLAYGFDSLPKPQKILIKNTTVWTNEKEGVLKNTDILLDNSKIVQIGTIEPTTDMLVIDGTGKHLTPGIIDEHSHIAISRGVNECTQAVTAEVSIADVINADDINIYRQLSGGVTAAQLLHGSCNPIGGQSGLIKLRWGLAPEQMKIKNAPKFIKFALGENVKQSNWGDFNTTRFPQTRMGVEQVYYDAFIRAKKYMQQWETYNKLKPKDKLKTMPPRKDLELETLVEILKGERNISCHSYQQSEINMLMHVADSMGFKVNTFTHILEGYKVADKMKKHGAGGSTFSDWWAYKYEVNDAIPYNGAIMHSMGIVTAFNSDDAEMGRRLNQEAAKAVKYGGVSEEEALKFVTLNPAKLLHLDDRMGSIKVGKDADVVLWSDHPLSIYAKVEKTIIDGIIYYDADLDKKMREAFRKDKSRIVELMLLEKKKGNTTQKVKPKEHKLYHCDTVEQ
ncbi:MAG: amidohydrolase family protein [Vicingaceae bacterium]